MIQTAKNNVTDSFEGVKRMVKQKQLIRKEASISELEIHEDHIIFQDKYFLSISKQAFNDLLNILNVPNELLKRFKESFGDEGKNQLVKIARDAIAAAGKKTVYLATSKETRMVERILPKAKSLGLSNDNLLQTIEEILNDNPNFVIDNYGMNNSRLTVNLINPKKELAIPGFNDEVFNTGISLNNSYDKGTKVQLYTNRLICTNGMTIPDVHNEYSIKTGNEKEWDKFFKGIQELKKRDYTSTKFVDKVQEAIGTNASFSEIENSAHLLSTHSNVGNDVNIFLPYLNTIKEDYKKIGIELSKLSKAEKKTAKSNVSVWKVINDVTDFASHEYSYTITSMQRQNLMIRAGSMLNSNFDLNNIVGRYPDHY